MREITNLSAIPKIVKKKTIKMRTEQKTAKGKRSMENTTQYALFQRLLEFSCFLKANNGKFKIKKKKHGSSICTS